MSECEESNLMLLYGLALLCVALLAGGLLFNWLCKG